MNYSKIYNSLVEKRKSLPPEGYSEKHHIIPKCLGGNDDVSNLVNLTAREHFVAHILLCKIHPKNFKLASAMTLMATDKSGNRINNKLYEYHRKMFARANSDFFKKHWKENDHPKGMLGKKHSQSSYNKVVKPLLEYVESKKKKVVRISLDNDCVEFESIRAATRSVSGNASNIKQCLDGKFKTMYNFRWEFK